MTYHREAVARRSDWHCVYCGQKITKFGVRSQDGQMDHFTARNAGGKDNITNYVLACAACNSRKNDQAIRSWLVMRALREKGFPGSLSEPQVKWLDMHFGPLTTGRFWYEDHPLKPLVLDRKETKSTKNRSKLSQLEIIERREHGEAVVSIAKAAGISRARVYSILAKK